MINLMKIKASMIKTHNIKIKKIKIMKKRIMVLQEIEEILMKKIN